MMSTAERLVYMANQIARNFAAIGQEAAAAATADHLASFWDPRMRQQIFALADAQNNGLEPIAAMAIALLKKHNAPSPQTGATVFAGADGAGHDDAG